MSQTRAKDQAVDAFSLPKELLEKAKIRAGKMGFTKSGFYRFCLAKELGYTVDEAALFAQHRAVLNSVEKFLEPVALNDASSTKVDQAVLAAGGKVNYKLSSRRKPAP